MKNKGYTLIELLAAIVVLGIVIMMAIPIVTSSISSSKSQIANEQTKMFEAAARTYMSQNSTLLPDNGKTAQVTISDLKKAGLIKDEKIKNPNYAKDSTEENKKHQYFDGCVTVTNTNNKFTYKYKYDCESSEDEDGDEESGKLIVYRWTFEQPWAIAGSEAASSKPYKITNMKKGTDYITETDFPTPSSRIQELNRINDSSPYIVTDHNYYLKHEINEKDEIISASVCFVYNNKEECLKGSSDGSTFEENKQKIERFQAYYSLPTVANPQRSKPGCQLSSSMFLCFGGGFYPVEAKKDGSVSVNESFDSALNNWCNVEKKGVSYCGSAEDPIF